MVLDSWLLTWNKKWTEDFLGGPVVKNPPANAGNTGSISGPSITLRSLHTRAHKPQLLKLAAPRACAPALQWETCAPHLPQLEKAGAKMKTYCSQKKWNQTHSIWKIN